MPDLFPAFAVALTDYLVDLGFHVEAEPVVAGRRRVVARRGRERYTFDYRQQGNEVRVDADPACPDDVARAGLLALVELPG